MVITIMVMMQIIKMVVGMMIIIKMVVIMKINQYLVILLRRTKRNKKTTYLTTPPGSAFQFKYDVGIQSLCNFVNMVNQNPDVLRPMLGMRSHPSTSVSSQHPKKTPNQQTTLRAFFRTKKRW
eukprot:UN03566